MVAYRRSAIPAVSADINIGDLFALLGKGFFERIGLKTMLEEIHPYLEIGI